MIEIVHFLANTVIWNIVRETGLQARLNARLHVAVVGDLIRLKEAREA